MLKPVSLPCSFNTNGGTKRVATFIVPNRVFANAKEGLLSFNSKSPPTIKKLRDFKYLFIILNLETVL